MGLSRAEHDRLLAWLNAHEEPTCEDCGRSYAPPIYYSTLTGTLCPDCAGPYLDPDTDGDPRRPMEDAR